MLGGFDSTHASVALLVGPGTMIGCILEVTVEAKLADHSLQLIEATVDEAALTQVQLEVVADKTPLAATPSISTMS